MQKLNLPETQKQLEQIRNIYLKAEWKLIEVLRYKRGRGLIDYAEIAALERIQEILRSLLDDSWSYVPRLIESQFYVNHPEMARLTEPISKHTAGYGNAAALTLAETDLVQRLTANLMGELTEAVATSRLSLETALGRLNQDRFRTLGVRSVAEMQAAGAGVTKSAKELVRAMEREGITAFVDRAGRRWRLFTYANMVIRTTSRQAEILAVLTKDPAHDLYQISSHGTTCPICAPLEGRVYSKSGTDTDFPPLALAFGKVDPAGADDLSNSYLNLHPNCLHVLIPWIKVGKSKEELRRIQQFSSFTTNPPTKDPRTQAQIDAYRKKERGRAQYLAAYRQYQQYCTTLAGKVPKTFQTFLKHKVENDQPYKNWVALYRAR